MWNWKANMLHIFVILILFLRVISSLNIDFCINYFQYRDVKQVCLITCEFNVKFTKDALKTGSFIVSALKIDSVAEYDKLESCLNHKYVPVGVLVVGYCQQLENVLYFASQYKFLDSMHYWLIEEANNNTNNNTFEIVSILDHLNISVDADIILSSRKDNFSYVLYDVLNCGKIQGGILNVTEVGSWSPENGLTLDVDLKRFKYYRRWNFQGWAMRIVLVAPKSEQIFDIKKLLELNPVPGVAIATQASTILIDLISEIHNFGLIITVVDRWISTFDRNSTKSVSNMIYFEEQDISPIIRYQTNMNERIGYLNPSVSNIETRYFYKIPTYGVGKFENQFLRPLSRGVWYAFMGVCVLCALSLLLSARFEHRPSSAQYAVFSVFASVCQQFFCDMDENGLRREFAARKLTVLVTGTACVLVYNYYTSSVVSWLLSGPPPSITSLQELLDSPLELIYEDQGYTRSWMQTPTYNYNKRNAEIENKIRQKRVYNKKKDAPLLVPLEKGIEMAKEGGYAYHAEVQSAYALISKTFTQSELCELGSLESMPRTDLYACVQKDSPYKEFITWSLLRLKERGIVSRVQGRTNALQVVCEGSSPRALALGGAAPVFILLAGGYLLAVCILLSERVVFRLRGHEDPR